MRFTILTWFFIGLFCFGKAQSSVRYDIDANIVKIENAYVDAWKKVGKMEGYRVQIAAFSSSVSAHNVKNEFKTRFPAQNAYVTYLEPNFRVRVGNFLNRVDAYRLLQQVQAQYPGAFIVKDQISIKDNY
ncbi:MAG: SPOR domain-containing protein [Bacteroidales bacterium]|jgi:hypothetical protein|nr:SPOR domain-containing protein [Bacteroidales bacterium]